MHMSRNLTHAASSAAAGVPLTYFNDGGGGGGGPSDFLGSMKDAEMFLGREKNRGIFGVAKKGLREFWGYAKL